MESYSDNDVLDDQPSTPIPNTKLKRLKKRSAQPPPPPAAAAASSPDAPIAPSLDSAPSGSPDGGSHEASGKDAITDADLDPLFAAPIFSQDPEPQRAGLEDEEMMDLELLRKKEKSAKKRLNLDEGEEGPAKKKKKGKPKESEREKRRIEKERRVHLDQIHAESQRLLRETRDASFKPVPLVQKPISSVLEKIRMRKMQVSKSSSFFRQPDFAADDDSLMGGSVLNSELSNSLRGTREYKSEEEAGASRAVDAGTSHGSQLDPNGTVPDPRDDSNDSQVKYRENNHLGDSVDDTLEDVLIASLSASAPKPDSDDVSSTEEDDDKENIDPYSQNNDDLDLYPKGGPVKAFVDDEAEEEDDSDNDMTRFQENDEDDKSDGDEELHDLIAKGFEEAPVDHDKRNELHRKWLEQQDAAATDNFLQQLNSGQNQMEHISSYEEEDESFEEDSEDKSLNDVPSSNVAVKGSKLAKQMITQMYNDTNDVYVPSDDEETEHTLIRQRLLYKTEEKTILSPLEDDGSREVFGLIKKLNIAPDSKKRGKKATSTFDMLTIGGNSNSSSKSSFLGRATSNSLPSSHKQGSATVRAFIFGRDDSDSRSNLSTSENVQDKGPETSKTSVSKFSTPQIKQIASKTEIDPNKSSSSSLFEILKQSSVHFDKLMEIKDGGNTHGVAENQTAYQFSAFKLRKRYSKVEARI